MSPVAVAFVCPEGDHRYVKVAGPVAVTVAVPLLPPQVAGVEPIVVVGTLLTVTACVVFAVHPEPLVTVTEIGRAHV